MHDTISLSHNVLNGASCQTSPPALLTDGQFINLFLIASLTNQNWLNGEELELDGIVLDTCQALATLVPTDYDLGQTSD